MFKYILTQNTLVVQFCEPEQNLKYFKHIHNFYNPISTVLQYLWPTCTAHRVTVSSQTVAQETTNVINTRTIVHARTAGTFVNIWKTQKYFPRLSCMAASYRCNNWREGFIDKRL